MSLFLFSGSNSFTLSEEVSRWKREFREKHGEENLTVLSGKNLKAKDLTDEAATAPFIATNRLLVVDGAPKFSKEDTEMLVREKHDSVIIMFVVLLDPSKKEKLPAAMKHIEAVCTQKTFPPISRGQLKSWAVGFLESQGGMTLDSGAYEKLIEIVGTDQMMLASELRKLAVYKGAGAAITLEDVQSLAMSSGEQEVWHVMDLLGSGKSDQALLYIQKLLDQGESPHGLWTRLLWMFSQITLVKAAVDEGITHPAALTKKAGVSFFAGRSLIPLAQKMSQEDLERFVNIVSGIDIDLKTGRLKATAEAPEELLAAMDGSMLQLSAFRS